MSDSLAAEMVSSDVSGNWAIQPCKAPIPVVKQLADALEMHKLRMGKLAQPNLPIFQAEDGKPLNLDNLVRREIGPALTRCAVCGKREDEHAKAEHEFNWTRQFLAGTAGTLSGEDLQQTSTR